MTGGTAPPATLGVAVALALGTAVALGLARFSYALFLPPMRADLGWSYLVSGAMNTANAVGYLAGALAAPAALRWGGARAALLAGMAGTALLLAAHGGVSDDVPLYVLRCLTGAVSAVAFVAGGVLATQLAGAPGLARQRARVDAGLVLGIYYAGTGLGIVASALLVPTLAGRVVPHAWQGAWVGLGALGLAATAVTALATRDFLRSGSARTTALTRSFAYRDFAPGLAAYFLFGLGYIGYVTFIVTLLREQRLSGGLVMAFFASLGAAVVASPWIWARMLQRFRGGETLCLLNALLVIATLLPVWSAAPFAVFASGLLFGGVMLSLVASSTALVRHNAAPSAWPAGITAFTIAFAAGQIVGPSLVGYIADRFGGLRGGLACSAGLLALAALIAWRQKPLARRGAS